MKGETAVRKALAYAPPSAFGRAAMSLVLLAGFYLLLLGLAAVLFVIPIAAIVAAQKINFLLIALVGMCWVPAALLAQSAFSARRAHFIPPPRRLSREEAPALFATVDELAARAGTAPPTEIYLDPTPNLAVTEVGSFTNPRRIMIVGGPLLCWLSVDELRAGIAHELGHFFGGDTRLTTFSLQTHALFSSVLDTVERDAFRQGTQHYAIEAGFMLARTIGNTLVKGYGHLYLRLTRPISRRQEFAADALAAALVSAPLAAKALEELAIRSPLYSKYLQEDVGFVVSKGAMPTDLVAGFERLRKRLLASEDGERFVQAVRSAPTEPLDTHPALLDRLRALSGNSADGEQRDDRPATALLSEPGAFDAWLCEATRELVVTAAVENGVPISSPLRSLSWQQVAEEVQAPAIRETARKLAERLHPVVPEATTMSGMFAAVWRRLESAPDPKLVAQVAPELTHLPPAEFQAQAQLVCLALLETLLQAALLEHGAQPRESLGAGALLLQHGNDPIDTSELVRSLLHDPPVGRAAFSHWAAQLEGP